jgi:putative chitinase
MPVKVSAELLRRIFPNARADLVRAIVAHWDAADAAEVDTPARAAYFFAVIHPETGGLRVISENLNYSAAGLRKVFPRYFKTDAIAARYAKRPEAIANIVYGGRMGNGNAASGDGWRYRGGGLGQTTGRDNYAAAGYDDNPDVLRTDPVAAFEAALTFWLQRRCYKFADRDDARGLRLAWNGGLNGYAEMQAALKLTKRAFGVKSQPRAQFVSLMDEPVAPIGDDIDPEDLKMGGLGDGSDIPEPEPEPGPDEPGSDDPPPKPVKDMLVANAPDRDSLVNGLKEVNKHVKVSELWKDSSIVRTGIKGAVVAGTGGTLASIKGVADAGDPAIVVQPWLPEWAWMMITGGSWLLFAGVMVYVVFLRRNQTRNGETI